MSVYGGDTCLCKVHEVEGEKQAGQRGQHRAFADPSGEEVYDGNHCDAEQGSDDTPAEGVHAEQ